MSGAAAAADWLLRRWGGTYEPLGLEAATGTGAGAAMRVERERERKEEQTKNTASIISFDSIRTIETKKNPTGVI